MKKNKASNKASNKVGRPKKISSLQDKQKIYQTKITDYDYHDTTEFIDPKKPKSLSDLGFTLPETPPTQVVSIRLPTILLNELRALGSQDDIPYQALIKIFLSKAVANARKKSS